MWNSLFISRPRAVPMTTPQVSAKKSSHSPERIVVQ